MNRSESPLWLADSGELAAVAALPAPSPLRSRWRRSRASAFRDPLSQGILTLTVSVTGGAFALLLLLDGSLVFGLALASLAVIVLGGHLLLAFQAFKRDKTIQFWSERRDLRLALDRQEAHTELLATTLSGLHALDRADSSAGARRVLSEVMEDVHAVLCASHDDVALVLALETEGRNWILSSLISSGSRWRALQPGKSCTVESTTQAALDALALHNRAVPVDTDHGILRIVVLSDTALTGEDQELFDQLPLCLRLIADRWRPAEPPLEPVALHSVG